MINQGTFTKTLDHFPTNQRSFFHKQRSFSDKPEINFHKNMDHFTRVAPDTDLAGYPAARYPA